MLPEGQDAHIQTIFSICALLESSQTNDGPLKGPLSDFVDLGVSSS
jgi:hypothetical protein